MRTGNEADGDVKKSNWKRDWAYTFPQISHLSDVCFNYTSTVVGGTKITSTTVAHPLLLKVVAVAFIAIWFDHCTSHFIS